MKLSEAIRLGAMMTPQVFHGGTGEGRCAIKTAALAMGKEHITSSDAEAMWPWLRRTPVKCPAGCDQHVRSAGTVLMLHLNDFHYWTRERIADWVASIEPQEEQAEVVGQGTREELAQRVEV